MSDNINFDYKNLSPFKWFVLENFPFIEADFDAFTAVSYTHLTLPTT